MKKISALTISLLLLILVFASCSTAVITFKSTLLGRWLITTSESQNPNYELKVLFADEKMKATLKDLETEISINGMFVGNENVTARATSTYQILFEDQTLITTDDLSSATFTGTIEQSGTETSFEATGSVESPALDYVGIYDYQPLDDTVIAGTMEQTAMDGIKNMFLTTPFRITIERNGSDITAKFDTPFKINDYDCDIDENGNISIIASGGFGEIAAWNFTLTLIGTFENGAINGTFEYKENQTDGTYYTMTGSFEAVKSE